MRLLITICLVLATLPFHAQISGEFNSTNDDAIRAISQSGRGVHGSSVLNHAIYGFSGSLSAVRGESLAGRGVEGYSNQENGVYGESGKYSGVYGIAKGKYGSGVTGFSIDRVGTSGVSQLNHGMVGSSRDSAGVYGLSSFSSGVKGVSPNHYAIHGVSKNSVGIYGSSEKANGVYGTSEGAPAIYGFSRTNTGIYAFSQDQKALIANSVNNHGILGVTQSENHFAFYASSPGSNNYGSASSRRWKENIVSISDPLEMLSQMRGVYYDWDEEHGGAHDIGFIAEEVGEVIPEIVVYEENGADAIGLDYSKVTPLLVEAIKAVRAEYTSLLEEQQHEIDALLVQMKQLEMQAQNNLTVE